MPDRCDDCGREVAIGEWPFCPHGFGFSRYFADEIPGGMTVENLGHTEVTVYSKSELARIAKSRGLEPMVRHVPLPGTDKSPHTTNWASVSKETLENAKVMLERVGTMKSREPDTSPDDLRPAEVEALLSAVGVDL